MAESESDLDALAARITAVRSTPASIGCAEVAATHYGARAWKDRLSDARPTDRENHIANARKAMQERCVAEAWSETVRACLVSEGSNETCFETVTDAVTWGYPARALLDEMWATLPLDCKTYQATVEKLKTCAKLSLSTRSLLEQRFEAAVVYWETIPAHDRDALIPSCTASANTVEQIRASSGCL